MGKLITEEMIDIFMWFDGDVDGYARLGKPQQRLIINDDDFCRLNNLIQSLDMINKNLVSTGFKEKVYQELHQVCDSGLVIERLEKFVKNDKKWI